MNDKDRAKCEESLKYYRDLKNSLDTAFDDGKKESYDELMPLIKQKEEELAQERQKAEQEHQKIIETAKFLKTHNVVDKIIAEKNTLCNIKIPLTQFPNNKL